MDPDIQELPTDYTQGLDFRITKTTKGSMQTIAPVNGPLKKLHYLNNKCRLLKHMAYIHLVTSFQETY